MGKEKQKQVFPTMMKRLGEKGKKYQEMECEVREIAKNLKT
jgi:hypothetical protein